MGKKAIKCYASKYDCLCFLFRLFFAFSVRLSANFHFCI